MDEMQEALFTTVKLEDFVPADHHRMSHATTPARAAARLMTVHRGTLDTR
jgi:hypothetical protein